MSALPETPGVTLEAAGLIALRQVALRSGADPALSNLPGGYATRRKGQGQEVADVREYVPGDDIRHLDRGSTARSGVLHVRQFQQERDRVCLLVADFRPPMLWGLTRAFLSVAAAEALALTGWRVVEEGGRVALLVVTPGRPVIVPPRGRVRGMLDVVGGLVRAHRDALEAVLDGATEGPALDGALSSVERLAPRGAEIVLATGLDRPGAGFADRLAALSRNRAPRLLVLSGLNPEKMPGGRYPICLPDGRRLRVTLEGRRATTAAPEAEVAGVPAQFLDAGQPVEAMARALALSTAPVRP
ncbi:DUF58 domain-containing protein [Ponticoccus alexandrii]|uniref:DUF58 domain-containing protein n=1 Tax=Ponticoccus alexandrii TaxID=1943633 RepID=A0ABX7F315_9RHOB|nr:DUF58 domain-containing protein [Ponticoccus alexandrii]ETA51309.1 hypothetical protein P279_14775 [Rhodobacteraceae bacterium PD-2]QRF64895.1 DUF58 domain-containing protein [Ponticoccus alexandrii]